MAANFPQRQSSALQSHRPKFCTIILHPEYNYLKIEKEFARRHGRDLPRTVFLKVHESDKLWKIKVSKSENGEVLFNEGWEAFIRYFSVRVGGFLVFTFDTSSSIFDIFIYDMTCVHIDGEIDEDEEEASSESDGDLGQVSEPKSASDDDTDNSLIRDRASGSRIFEPRTFTRKLTIHDKYTVKLPNYFTEGLDASSLIMLKDVEGRELKAKLCGKEGAYALCSGWKDFLVNNKVTIGSTLSFEHVSVHCSLIKVEVLSMGTDKNLLFEYVRKEKGGKPHCVVPRGHSRENTAGHTKKKDTDTVTNQEGGSRSHPNCSFRRQIPFSSRYRLELSRGFNKRSEINSHVEITLKNVEGRGWLVANTCRTNGRCTFGTGWHNFLVDNKVIVGSTLEFKLISESPCIIEVRVVKSGANRIELFTYPKRGPQPRKGPKRRQ